jgi:hypothetical protein
MSMMMDHEASSRRSAIFLLSSGIEYPRRLVAKVKGLPLLWDHVAGIQIVESLKGLIYIHIIEMHEPGRVIGGG